MLVYMNHFSTLSKGSSFVLNMSASALVAYTSRPAPQLILQLELMRPLQAKKIINIHVGINTSSGRNIYVFYASKDCFKSVVLNCWSLRPTFFSCHEVTTSIYEHSTQMYFTKNKDIISSKYII